MGFKTEVERREDLDERERFINVSESTKGDSVDTTIDISLPVDSLGRRLEISSVKVHLEGLLEV